MGNYHGASTLVPRSWFGTSREDVEITAIALVGPRGFETNDQFRRYCDMVDRMRAYAANYEQSAKVPGAREQIETMIISTIVEVSKMEMGKDRTLFDRIKQQLGWPLQFVQDMLRAPEMDDAPAMAM